MGCGSSTDVMSRIKDQEKKIDNLIEINQNLQKRLTELNSNHIHDAKQASDTNDLTNLKTTIDVRFNKLEKTVEKIHNEFKAKLFEGIVDNLENGIDNINRKASLTLNFEKENIVKTLSQSKKEVDPHWNELLYDSNMTPQRLTLDKLPDEASPRNGNGNLDMKNFIDHNDIQMELNNHLNAKRTKV